MNKWLQYDDKIWYNTVYDTILIWLWSIITQWQHIPTHWPKTGRNLACEPRGFRCRRYRPVCRPTPPMARMARSLRRYLGYYPRKRNQESLSTGGKGIQMYWYAIIMYIICIYNRIFKKRISGHGNVHWAKSTNLTKNDQRITTSRIIVVRLPQPTFLEDLWQFDLRMLPAVDVISRSSQEVKASLAPWRYENDGIPFHSDDKASKITRKKTHKIFGAWSHAYRNSDACKAYTKAPLIVSCPTSKRWMIRTNDSPKSSDNLRDGNPIPFYQPANLWDVMHKMRSVMMSSYQKGGMMCSQPRAGHIHCTSNSIDSS